MDQLAISDRRQLRRKLGFWRALTIGLLLLAGVAAYLAFAYGQNGNFGRAHIARVTIAGIIQDDRELVDRLDRIAHDPAVKGLIVSISSPGGTTYGGEVIYKAIRRVADKKPVISDIRTLAASAGYLIALGGDHIVAGESSITGSIGVLFQYPQVKTLMDRIGVSLEEIKSAPLKAEPSPFHPPSEAAKAVIQAMIDDSYGWFVDIVAARRNLPREQALGLADGRIFTGRQALSLKLVDRLGGDEAVMSYFRDRKVAADLRVLDWEPSSSGLPFGLRSALSMLIRSTGLDAFAFLQSLETFGRDKLFLDGLVSVWQVGND